MNKQVMCNMHPLLKGQYLFEIQELHSIYECFIPINPYKLHVMDPEILEITHKFTTRFPYCGFRFSRSKHII